MPTNIFFKNPDNHETIEILRMLEAREEKLSKEIEALKETMRENQENLSSNEKERLINFLNLVPLMDNQEVQEESSILLAIVSKYWQEEVLLNKKQRGLQNIQKVIEEILKTDITFALFGKKNCPHRFVETEAGLKCICCGHSTKDYKLSFYESLYLVEAAKTQGILIRNASVKEIPFLEKITNDWRIAQYFTEEKQSIPSAKTYEKQLITAREQDLRKTKSPILNTKEAIRFFKKIETEKKEIEQSFIELKEKALVDDEIKRNYDRLLELKKLASEESLVATYEIYILMGYSLEDLYYEEQAEENKYAVVKAYYNLSQKHFQKSSGYFKKKSQVESFTCTTTNPEMNQMILDRRIKR